MPDPSYWPALAALGLALLFGGMIFLSAKDGDVTKYHLTDFWLSAVGLVVMVISIYAWSLEPAAESH